MKKQQYFDRRSRLPMWYDDSSPFRHKDMELRKKLEPPMSR